MNADAPGSVAGRAGALGHAALAHSPAAERLARPYGLAADVPYAASPSRVEGQVVRELVEAHGWVATLIERNNGNFKSGRNNLVHYF